MKPIPLTYLREKLSTVSSRFELARLFVDSYIDDHGLSRWISRTIRSATHFSGHGLTLDKMPHNSINHPQDEDNFVDEIVKQKDKSAKENTKSMVDSLGDNSREKEVYSTMDGTIEGSEDDDYNFDYPQDEPTHDDLEAFEAALHHLEEMNSCSSTKCQHPKPFVQSVQDPHNRMHMFLPECVVLYRCMNHTGCCGDSNHECVPKSMSIVTKAFLMVDRHSDNDRYVMFNPKMTAMIAFVNHTECECREKPKLLKCTKVCPKPFRLKQEGTDCKCDCFPKAFHDSWPCERIKDGVVGLSHDGLVCIKNGKCYIPECTVGDFDIKSGLCPLSDEYALPAFFFGNPEERRTYRDHLSSYDFSKSHTIYPVSGNGDITHPTLSKQSGFSEEHVDTIQDSSLLVSIKPSTVQLPMKKSEFSLEKITRSTHSVTNSQSILENSVEFTHEDAKVKKVTSENYPDKPNSRIPSVMSANAMENSEDIWNASTKASDKQPDSHTDVYEDVLLTNTTHNRHNKSEKQFNVRSETSDVTKSTVHNVHDKKLHKASNYEEVSSESETSQTVSDQTSSKTALFSKSSLESSSREYKNQKHKKTLSSETAEDGITRKGSPRDSQRHRLHLNSRDSHENYRSVEFSTKPHTIPSITSDKNYVKPSQQFPSVSSSQQYLSTPSLPRLQITTPSSTSGHLQTTLPNQEDHDQKTLNQRMLQDQEYSMTSNEKYQKEEQLNYDYDVVDGSGD